MSSLKSARKARAAALTDNKKKDLRWWLDDEPHESIFALAERIDRHNQHRHASYLAYACLYDDSELASLITGSGGFASSVPNPMTTNIVRRQVDTYTAKVSKNRPIPMALTSGGNYGAQRRAKAITKLFEGLLHSVGYYNIRPLRIRDAAIFGSGFAHNYRVGKKLIHERVFPWEISVDPREAMRGKPRTIFKHSLVDKLVLAERFPKFAEEIEGCQSRQTHASVWDTHGSESTNDLALVREAWHLPSAEDMKQTDGAHVICISNATLVSEEYGRDYFQFSKNDFSPPLVGWFGEGMVKGLAGLQGEANEIGLRLQEMAYMTGSYVWVPDGSGIETELLDNGALTIIKSAIKPDFMQPPAWHPQFFSYYEKLRGSFAQDITGISSLSSRSEIPQGIESGKAIRTYHQIDAENLVPQGREDERDCVDTAWQLFDLMEEIHDETKGRGEKYTVKVERNANGRTFLEDIDFAKVRMAREDFSLTVHPTSFLATTPEDRWSQVKEMSDAGLFSQDEVLTLLDFPDVQRVLNLRGAPRKVIEKIIERILDSDDPVAVYPEPTMNLDLCVALGTLAYLEAKWIDEADEKNTSVLLDFVINAKNLRDNPDGKSAGGVNGGAGPQPGSQSPNAPPEAALPQGAAPPPPPAGGALYAPPDEAPMPANAVAPDAMPPIPQVQ